MNTRIVTKKYLSGETKYCYCPICVNELESEGKDWKAQLKPLLWVKTAEPMPQKDGTVVEYIDEHYECSRCKFTNITVETFRRYYVARPDGTKLNEQPKSPTVLWSKDQNCFVQADWNGTQFVERKAQ